MPYVFPQLKYAYDALEPYIDTKTMETHHGKHHKTYVDRFNTAIAGKPELISLSGEEIIAGIDKVPRTSGRPCAITAAARSTIRFSGRSWLQGRRGSQRPCG